MASRLFPLAKSPLYLLTGLPLANPTPRTQAERALSRLNKYSFLPILTISIPTAIHINIPDILSGLWGSILRAVPKKKTSHMKKRHRQMAGKALKDVTALNKCPACGSVKRAHFLCPYCVDKIKERWKDDARDVAIAKEAKEQEEVEQRMRKSTLERR